MRHIIAAICFLSIAGSGSTTMQFDALLRELDQVIMNEKEYIVRKEMYLGKLKDQLIHHRFRDVDQCFIYLNIAKEYETYKCDSSVAYCLKAIATARKANNQSWLDEGRIQWARSEAKRGMFPMAVSIFDSIRSGNLNLRQREDYYKGYVENYIYWIEYQDGYNLDEQVMKRDIYLDSLLQILEPGNFDYVTFSAHRYIARGEIQKAQEILTDYLPKVKPDTREMAGITSILSHIYNQTGDYKRQQEYLIISAMSDIKACIKENISLRALAVMLFEAGDIHRANQYIKKSLDDANFYNARLRNIQTSKVMPIIDKAYQMDREHQQHKSRNLLIMVSVLSMVLLAAILCMAVQMRKLAQAKKYIERVNLCLSKLNTALQQANERQQQTNVHLAEANHIKELFIGNFLEICTEYIEKLRAFKLMVKRKVRAGQGADLIRITSSTESSAQEMKELYDHFDRAFLNIYPTFVEEFNALLRPKERYPVNENKSLNQELRIFALIKLGIRDTNKITTFLNYVPRTVYNYRSKVKSKAIDQDEDFEERVKQIGSNHLTRSSLY